MLLKKLPTASPTAIAPFLIANNVSIRPLPNPRFIAFRTSVIFPLVRRSITAPTSALNRRNPSPTLSSLSAALRPERKSPNPLPSCWSQEIRGPIPPLMSFVILSAKLSVASPASLAGGIMLMSHPMRGVTRPTRDPIRRKPAPIIAKKIWNAPPTVSRTNLSPVNTILNTLPRFSEAFSLRIRPAVKSRIAKEMWASVAPQDGGKTSRNAFVMGSRIL